MALMNNFVTRAPFFWYFIFNYGQARHRFYGPFSNDEYASAVAFIVTPSHVIRPTVGGRNGVVVVVFLFFVDRQ